ncbi:MAG TPA: hypothetical protein VFC73_03525 [Syntrophomonadaceae bacterium]|nr:hypothetical protein [Syntrophomonadaceae bacterium]
MVKQIDSEEIFMRFFQFEPINYIGNKVEIPLKLEDVMDYKVYEDMWLENDDTEIDILRLIERNNRKF